MFIPDCDFSLRDVHKYPEEHTHSLLSCSLTPYSSAMAPALRRTPYGGGHSYLAFLGYKIYVALEREI